MEAEIEHVKRAFLTCWVYKWTRYGRLYAYNDGLILESFSGIVKECIWSLLYADLTATLYVQGLRNISLLHMANMSFGDTLGVVLLFVTIVCGLLMSYALSMVKFCIKELTSDSLCGHILNFVVIGEAYAFILHEGFCLYISSADLLMLFILITNALACLENLIFNTRSNLVAPSLLGRVGVILYNILA